MATIAEAYDAALAHHQAGRLDAAETLYRRILDADPAQADAEHLLGVAAAQRGRFDEAAAFIVAAVGKRPHSAAYRANLGGALQQAGRCEEAAAVLRRALALDPASVDGLVNLGASLTALGAFDAAVGWSERAVAAGPQRFEARLNHAVACRDRGLLAKAEASFAAARGVKPDDARLACELAALRLSQGAFAEGWRLFENRWAFLTRHPCAAAAPPWRGEDLAGKSILLHYEQGLGDTVQFARYAAVLAERGARATLLTQPSLRRLMGSLFGAAQIITDDDPPPAVDFVCPLMSLPLASGAVDPVPAPVDGYLRADADLIAAWSVKLAALGLTQGAAPERRPRVGLVWAGNPRRHDPKSNALDRRRSLTFEQIAPLLDVPGVDFVSLQMGRATGRGADVEGARMIDPMGEVADFADTAAIMANLDLVATVDTSAAHVAAATGRPVWMLSRFDGCWRWLRDRDDSPWYPGLRLYRQEAPGDWGPPLRRLADDMAAWAAAFSIGGAVG